MIPTAFRSKIPGGLAYPLSAKTMSDTLGDVPQTDELRLWFWRGETALKPDAKGRQYVCAVHYDHYISHLGPYDTNWRIEINPVPREIVGRVTELLRTEGLERIRDWLLARRNPIWYEAGKCLILQYSQAEDSLILVERGGV